VTISVTATLSQSVIGNPLLVPAPIVSNSVVLYAGPNVTVTLPFTFANQTTIPKSAVVQSASVSFNVTYLASAANIQVLLTDIYGNSAGNVTSLVTSSGITSVDISSIYNYLLTTYQQSFVIRAIHGSVLKLSLGIATQNVSVNIDQSSVTSEMVYTTTQQSPTPTSITTSTPTPTPTSTPNLTLNSAVTFGVSNIMIIIALILNLLL
jgi:hypothetical protein